MPNAIVPIRRSEVREDRTLSAAVIGGAGFLGSQLVERLMTAGRHVDVIDDLSTGSIANLAQARRLDGSLKIHNFDIDTDEGLAVLATARPSVVYHLALFDPAAAPGGTVAATSKTFRSALAVVDLAARLGSSKVVVALPATTVYGRPGARDLPLKEGPLEARGLVGIAAKAIVDALVHHREVHDLEFTALAMTNVYGPRQRAEAGVVARFVEAAATDTPPAIHGDGRQTRDLLFVDDAVEALVQASSRGGGLVINVGTGEQTSIRDLWRTIAPDGPAADGARPRVDEIGRFALSAVRARIHLAWSPWTSLTEGLAETIARRTIDP